MPSQEIDDSKSFKYHIKQVNVLFCIGRVGLFNGSSGFGRGKQLYDDISPSNPYPQTLISTQAEVHSDSDSFGGSNAGDAPHGRHITLTRESQGPSIPYDQVRIFLHPCVDYCLLFYIWLSSYMLLVLFLLLCVRFCLLCFGLCLINIFHSFFFFFFKLYFFGDVFYQMTCVI